MGLGLLKLVAIGKENKILNDSPEITFFKKKLTNINYFKNENINQYFKSQPNFGRKMTVNISKVGDLISDITLFMELQDIPPSNHSLLPKDVKQFAWINKIAFGLIKYIDLEIDGILIERQYNDYLNILYETELYGNTDLDKVIGNNIKVLTDYSNGKLNYKLHLPLKFFFNLEKYLSLPLYLLNKQDIKIHVEFNNFIDCYKETPTHYFEINDVICLFQKDEIITQNVNSEKTIGIFKYFDIINKRVYYEKIYNSFIIPSESNKTNTIYNIIGKNSNFKIIPKFNTIIVKDESYFLSDPPPLKNAYIDVNYIFLDYNVKKYFINERQLYIVPVVQNILDKDISSINNNYKLNLTNPHKILYWRAILDSNKQINDLFNYSSLPITDNKEPLINKVRLIINSIPRVEIDNYEFYTFFQDYINILKSNNYIYKYAFCEYPKDNTPNGTMNFSKVDDAYLELKLNSIVSFQNSINIKLYGVHYNILVIDNNNSSFKFVD